MVNSSEGDVALGDNVGSARTLVNESNFAKIAAFNQELLCQVLIAVLILDIEEAIALYNEVEVIGRPALFHNVLLGHEELQPRTRTNNVQDIVGVRTYLHD